MRINDSTELGLDTVSNPLRLFEAFHSLGSAAGDISRSGEG